MILSLITLRQMYIDNLTLQPAVWSFVSSLISGSQILYPHKINLVWRRIQIRKLLKWNKTNVHRRYNYYAFSYLITLLKWNAWRIKSQYLLFHYHWLIIMKTIEIVTFYKTHFCKSVTAYIFTAIFHWFCLKT